MMTDDELRLQLKILKAKGVYKTYKEIAEEFHFTPKSFSSWLNGRGNTDGRRKKLMEDYIASHGDV